MKVLAINGSARKDGNTAVMLRAALAPIEAAGIETELAAAPWQGHPRLRRLHAVLGEKKRALRHQKGHAQRACIDKMVAADGMLIGSPTYFANVSSNIKSIIDRAGMVSLANGYALARKVGAAVVAVRRGGAIHVFNSINHFFFINQVVVPGSSYWNLGRGLEPGDVENDAEGLETMTNLGANMAWVLQKLHA